MRMAAAAADPTANGCIATARSATAIRRELIRMSHERVDASPPFFSARQRGDGFGRGPHAAVMRAMRSGEVAGARGLSGEEDAAVEGLCKLLARADVAGQRVAVRTADARHAAPMRAGERPQLSSYLRPEEIAELVDREREAVGESRLAQQPRALIVEEAFDHREIEGTDVVGRRERIPRIAGDVCFEFERRLAGDLEEEFFVEPERQLARGDAPGIELGG